MSPPSSHTPDFAKELRIFQCQTRTACPAVSPIPLRTGNQQLLCRAFTASLLAQPVLTSARDVQPDIKLSIQMSRFDRFVYLLID